MSNLRMLAFVAMVAVGLQIVTAYPGDPVLPASACLEEGYMFADSSSMCWYHLCLIDAEGYFYTLPRRCALRSKVDYQFVEGLRNPCTVNFNTDIGFECERLEQAADFQPACTTDGSVTCYNGGTLTYEANHCWCLCDLDWEGDFDCSKPTGFYDALAANPDFSGNNICVDGQPDDDYCYLGGGCENGGICYNQCKGFWCECPDIDEYEWFGSRCETYFKK